MLRYVIVALACVGLGGCGEAGQEPRTGPGKRDRGEPIFCSSDAECPPLSCGPCNPGEVVRRLDGELDCGFDPCIGGGSVCGADHVCVVRPGAKKDPAVWCRNCYLLEADTESICAAAEAKAVCEQTLAEAVASCDDDRCAATRASMVDRAREREPILGDPQRTDELTPAQVAAGFEKARAAVLACPGGVPGLKIKVRADITSKGTVVAAKPLSSLPVASCAAAAVEEHARFASTERPLQSKHFTYEF